MHETHALSVAVGAFVLLATSAGAATGTLIVKDGTGDAPGGGDRPVDGDATGFSAMRRR